MKKEFNFTCDKCGKQAVYNVQSACKTYKITNDEDFELIEDEPDGNYNEFYCEECYQKIDF